jgi:hypothetical protein
MAEEVVIKTVLDLSGSEQRTQQQVEKALRAAEAKTVAHQRRLEAIHLQSGSRIQQIEAQRISRLDAVHLQSAARLQQIEARHQAQIGAIRERALVAEQNRLRRLESAAQASSQRITNAFRAIGGIGIGLGVAGLGASAISKAFDFDQTRVQIAAFVGGIDNANKKLAEFSKIAQATAGVSRASLVQAFIDLKAQARLADDQASKLAVSIAKLQALFPKAQDTARNLAQIFSQGFELQDIKQERGQTGDFIDSVIKRLGFEGPKSIELIRAAQKAGKVTQGAFWNAVDAEVVARSKNLTESLQLRMTKALESTNEKLAALGDKLVRDIIPILDKILPLVNSVLGAFTAMPTWLQATTAAFVVLGPSIVTATNAIIGLAGSIGTLSAAGLSPGLVALARFGLIGAPLAVGFAVTRNKINEFNQQLAARAELATRQPGTLLDATAEAQRQAQIAALEQARITGVLTPELAALFPGAKKPPTIKPPTINPPTLGGIGGRRDRFVGDGGQGEAEKLLHEAALAAVRQSNLGRVLRRQQPFDLASLPRLSVTAPGLPDLGFPGQELADLARIAAEIPAKIAPIMSDVERFMSGFNSQIETVGDSFDRFGANVAHAFTNVKTLFDGLKRAVLDFFNDLLGNALQNLVRGTLSGIFGGGGGGSVGNFFGNLFRAPSFAGAAGGGGISAPASVSEVSSLARSLFPGAGGGGSSSASGFGKLALDPLTAKEFGLGGSFLGGIGKSFAAAAPLLGLSLGAGLGGQSAFGQIAGSAGGLLGGGAVAGFSGLLGKAATKFFTNPFTIAIGAGLLVGSFFLGRAKQRKQDEELSGQFLTQALAGIDQLASAVSSGQITSLVEARSVFDNQILGVFAQQISGLKTKSVRQSRLSNQVRDLRNVFEARIPPLINEANQRRVDAERAALIHNRLIPEFATGGIHSRGGLAILHPGEMVLNGLQQATIALRHGADVFSKAGVPGVQPSASFPHGGIYAGGQPAIEVTVLVGTEDQTRVFVNGALSPQGQKAISKQIGNARRERGER